MQIGMTHLSQSAVLRYMEANKRIRVRSRCPAVQVYERHIPLYVKSVSILDRRIVLNDLSYSSGSLYLVLHKKQLVVVRDMRVSTYIFSAPFFPIFRAENLDFQADDLQEWIRHFDGYSFPLRKLTVYESTIQDTMYCTLTKNLIIKYHSQLANNRVLRILTDQNIERVEVDSFGESEPPLRSLMENTLLAWMANGRPIGTRVSFTSVSWFYLTTIIDSLQRRHGGRAVHFRDDMGRRRTLIERATAVPYNETSEIVIYYCKHYGDSWMICMQMMSTGVAHNGHFTIADWMVIVLLVVLAFLVLWGASYVYPYLNGYSLTD